MKRLVASLMGLSLVLTGCGVGNIAQIGSASGSKSGITVVDLKQKYGVANDQAMMPLYNVENDKQFTFKFKSSMEDQTTGDVIAVYTDPKCLEASKVESVTKPDYTTDKSVEFTVRPPVAVLASKSDTDKMEANIQAGEQTDSNGKWKNIGVWGNAPIYYMKINYDMDSTTVKKLDKPIITPFTIKSDLTVPNLKSSIDKDGRFKLTWNKVDGAEKYNIYVVGFIAQTKQTGAETGYQGYQPYEYDTTTGTEWDNILKDGEHGLNSSTGMLSDNAMVIKQNDGLSPLYFVTAVSGAKESRFSAPVNIAAIQDQLPISIKSPDYLQRYDSASLVPKKATVLMEDGTTQERDIVYDTTSIDLAKKDTFIQIGYKVKGTALESELTVTGKVTDQDKQNLGQAVPDQNPSGYVKPVNNSDTTPKPDVKTVITSDGKTPPTPPATPAQSTNNNTNTPATPAQSTTNTTNTPAPATPAPQDTLIDQQKQNTKQQVDEGNKGSVPDVSSDIKINANSALEEYLARQMIAVSSTVSLKAFPEVQNSALLEDVLTKVMYQNPMVLNLEGYEYDYNTLTLNLKYNDSADSIKKKQQEIVTEANKIVASTIKSDMSDEEKRKALYDYLDKNTKYDQDALKSAEQNNFKNADPKYNDSFNTYGIMVKKVGVCASYAATYKMLCDVSNVPCIVVTGTSEGVPHAWNKVKIDSEWVTTDITNNGTNCGIDYLLYEANDATVKEMNSIPNKDFWTDADIDQFAGSSNKNEYYTVNKLAMASLGDYQTTLTDDLKKGDKRIVLRLDLTEDHDTIMKSTATVFNDVAKDKMDTVKIGEIGSYIDIKTQ